MPPVRRLTAIIAADVAGYSRLMGADEEGTHERLKGHLQELIDPKITEHRGRIVKNTGDGLLAEFASVVDAVRCAVGVQRGMSDRNAATPPEKRIEFRVGINLGDVIAEEGRHLQRWCQRSHATGDIGGAGWHLHLASSALTQGDRTSAEWPEKRSMFRHPH
jgi:class 3 adenylate cyclase